MTEVPQLDAVIRQRKTTKVLASQSLPVNNCRSMMEEMVELAGWAPFHRPCDCLHTSEGLTGMVPWRMYLLDGAACRKLVEHLPATNAGKLPQLLAAADGLIQTTWLPNPPCESAAMSLYDPTLANMEHIAAASAAVQNVLLAATDRGIPNYWSSGGGLLREQPVFELLGIPPTEILLASIFLFPTESGEAEVVHSKLRAQRPNASTWSRWVQL